MKHEDLLDKINDLVAEALKSMNVDEVLSALEMAKMSLEEEIANSD